MASGERGGARRKKKMVRMAGGCGEIGDGDANKSLR